MIKYNQLCNIVKSFQFMPVESKQNIVLVRSEHAAGQHHSVHRQGFLHTGEQGRGRAFPPLPRRHPNLLPRNLLFRTEQLRQGRTLRP